MSIKKILAFFIFLLITFLIVKYVHLSADVSKSQENQRALDNKNSRVSKNYIYDGGPKKDSIPSIDSPKFTTIQKARYLDDEKVIGVYINGEAKAYPYKILNWHEIVNDEIGGIPISVTYSPLCDTNPVFIRKIDGRVTTFGVTGKLYQSCLVMYDKLSNSKWSQPLGIGIMGEHVNYSLKQIPAFKTTVSLWRQKHPNSLILNSRTGFDRDYSKDPYLGYSWSNSLWFPVSNLETLDSPPKEEMSYIWHAEDSSTPKNKFVGDSFQVSHKMLSEIKMLKFIFRGEKSKVIWDEDLKSPRFFVGDKEVPASTGFKFVCSAFFNKSDTKSPS